jgi:hypothetical protein
MEDNILPFNKFKNSDGESCDCDTCKMAYRYCMEISDADTVDKLVDTVNRLIIDAQDLGMKQLLQQQIRHNTELLHHLDNCCDDECDCD